ncbi:MAG TPA: tetratricopeptide repeat protein [Pyrinomonadaceae bacterium]|nr:tetratricopeptide repeat protein [Pyrinomonadaceae bacterium]
MEIARKKNAPLEQRQRLSRSVLWQLQRNFFDRQGIEAWRTSGVPYHITSNPFIAAAYAKVVFGFLRDCHAAAAASDSSPSLDPAQPLYVVELGSGHGRFGYLFLKRFLKTYRASVLRGVPFKYVLTDFTERNLEYWQSHPWLRPFIDEGVLDLALFNVEHDGELRLVNSGEVLSAETLRNPLAVIANYVFDSVPQDAFVIQGGQLYESLVTVSAPRKGPAHDDPEILPGLEISYTANPAEGNYYGDPEWDRILQECRERLPNTAFLFPLAALQCVRNFRRLSRGRMLLLSADKGYNRDEALLQGQGIPGIVMHASFSMMVDYHIIGRYFLNGGGQAMHPTHQHEHLNISAFTLGGPPGGYAETRQAYAEAVEDFGPDDFFTLTERFEMARGGLSFPQMLALLRLSGWDHLIFRGCLSALKEHVAEIPEAQKHELHRAVRQVWDAYYPIGEEDDLAFQLGTLLLEMEFYSEALELLRHSVDLYGAEPGTAYNMAVCFYGLRQTEKALECVGQAIELDPEFDAAKALRIQLQSAAAR